MRSNVYQNLKTMNVFMILPGKGIYLDPKTMTPWQVFQLFIPGRKFDVLFGTN
jgi:hypothetical protein